MKIKINANRMNLLKLRKRLKFAVRGHKLLKDKQEQLTKEFNSLIYKLLELRLILDKHLEDIYSYMRVVFVYKTNQEIENFLNQIFNNYKFSVEEKFVNKYNVKFKEYIPKNISVEDKILSSDFYLNCIAEKLKEIYRIIIEMSNLENLCENIAKALQTTRRRVNALEYVLIPQLKQAIKYIVNKLNEFERTNITQLMRIKQIM